MKAYCVDKYDDILSCYEDCPVEFTQQYLNEWISKIPNDKRTKYMNTDLLICNMREFYYTATLKGVNKATGESTIGTKVPKGQVINAMPESVCLYYSLVMRDAIDRIRAMLRPNVLLAIGFNDDYINILG
uniref:RNA-dependent RNA polymerase n=1 Tax=Hattiesburg toga-like virus TaxID=2789616 RepID=A0A7T1GW07_9VIRU|nr:RNA-dependent RNA polymerase [Hattiesburg toga-like virus]